LISEESFLNALREWMEISMHRSFHAFIRNIRESALSFSQINTLFRLHHHGPSPVNDLADHLGISMAAVSQLLEPLKKAGLIQRSEDPSDRRVKLIALTENGEALVKKNMRNRHAWLGELADTLTPEEKEQLLPSVLLLTKHIRALNVEAHRPCESH
jgi:DNA-binding MarR family transcriptional regulator